jgi:polyisoprenoid-binding protein YceI
MKKSIIQASASALTAFGILLGVSASGYAALTSASETKVTFVATGPAGLAIEGTTPDLTATEQGGNLVISVPLGNLSTGIGLRDKHMKEKYLEVGKYPNAVLTVARAALKIPAGGGQVESDVPGQLQLHGQTKTVTVHYQSKGEGAGLPTHGKFRINMNDFGIQVPTYLGVTVKPEVEVNAAFRVAGS